jgi:26S proteasome regulatory subunit T6
MLEVSHHPLTGRICYKIRDFLVRLLREELQLLHEPGSYVGEVVKVMGKNKVLVKVQPEGKYSTFFA